MKKIIIFLLILCSNSLFATTWYTNFENARKVAITTNKLIIVDFWATWCGPCKKMDSEVWSDTEIQKKMGSFVPLKIDLDIKRNLANRFNVKAIPYIFIIDGNGEIVFQSRGYMDKQETLEMLETYALNTNFLQTEAIQYYKNPTYVTALRLSQKYLDYSLFVDQNVNRDILNLSSIYLREAEKLTDKDQSNYKMIDQKIELLEANIDLYQNNYRKLNRYLERKIEDDELKQSNWAIYSFLNYCSAVEQDQQDLVIKWKKELINSKNGDVYITRAEKFLAIK